MTATGTPWAAPFPPMEKVTVSPVEEVMAGEAAASGHGPRDTPVLDLKPCFCDSGR